MQEVIVKVINKSNHPLPSYQTLLSAGADLHAFTELPISLEPMERKLVGTGLFLEIPPYYEIQIRPRSGLAFKNGITVLNAPGTIDADYRGEIKVLLINLSQETFVINNGDRIAQMVLHTYQNINWQKVNVLEESQRGEQGYGHTGK